MQAPPHDSCIANGCARRLPARCVPPVNLPKALHMLRFNPTNVHPNDICDLLKCGPLLSSSVDRVALQLWNVYVFVRFLLITTWFLGNSKCQSTKINMKKHQSKLDVITLRFFNDFGTNLIYRDHRVPLASHIIPYPFQSFLTVYIRFLSF